MEDFELLLFDRIEKIKSINEQYDLENNAYISFSGGKDSTILHHLIDLALPNNKIPRVFINTGIEYSDIVNFVKELATQDDRFVIIQHTKNIKQTLAEYGYPFKSKQHSHNIAIYQRNKELIDDFLKEDIEISEQMPRGTKSVIKYFKGIRFNKKGEKYEMSNFSCPKKLQYQFDKTFTLNISDQCCYKLKKEPIDKWQKETNRKITITGMRKEEGGNRTNLTCIITDKKENVIKFHPLSVVSDSWCEWFIGGFVDKLCKLYYPPYNFKRTGCKGCPFALTLQEQLDIMEIHLPNEKDQCERIWKPVYDEYRRINYRLRGKGVIKQTNIYDFIDDAI